jgi:hypothetical protein
MQVCYNGTFLGNSGLGSTLAGSSDTHSAVRTAYAVCQVVPEYPPYWEYGLHLLLQSRTPVILHTLQKTPKEEDFEHVLYVVHMSQGQSEDLISKRT